MDRRVVMALAIVFIAIAAAVALVCFVPYSHSDDSMTATADESECLNFTFPEGGGYIEKIVVGTYGGADCKYSLDGKETWTDFESGKEVKVPGGGKIYVKGNNPNGFSKGAGTDYTQFGISVKISGKTVSASGNVMSLIDDGMSTTLTIPNDFCFFNLFGGCDVLSVAPALPATTLKANCYANMFSGCTSLTAAPTLPADTLAAGCYNGMFSKCTSLTAAPALPADTLAMGCYNGMFYECTALTAAPALPADTLAVSCYNGMFFECTSLTAAPALPVDTLAAGCYNEMFSECTSLTAAPALPADTLAVSCYANMFSGCTSLTAAPALPADTLAASCYANMFSGCTSLTAAPALPADTLAASCYANMFSGCTSLTAAPALPADTLAASCYANMFSGCTSLNRVLCFATNINAPGCTSNWLSGVPSAGNFYMYCDKWGEGESGIPSGWTEHYNDFVAVVFDPMGGTPIRDGKPITNYSIADSSRKIDLPSAERTEWAFEGWYDQPEGGTKIEPDTKYDKDTTIYAHWKKCTLTFDPKGGSDIPSPINSGGNITLPTTVPTYSGNTFIGWRENGKDTIYSPGDKYNLTADVTLYAVWGGTIVFNPTVGTGEFEPLIKENNINITIPVAPIHATLTFQGWCDGTTIYNPGDKYTVSGDVTFYAMWSNGGESGYMASFDTDGGSFTQPIVGIDITLPSAPSKTGYTFGGWNDGTSTKDAGSSYTLSKDTKFTAVWTPITYTVHFNGNEQTGGSMSDQAFKYDEFKELAKNAFTKTGYSFLGWSTTSGGKIEYVDEAKVGNLTSAKDGVVNLYAVWKAVQGETFAVSFDLDGGTGNFPAITTSTGTVTLYSEAPVKTGYAFKEWKCGDKTYKKGATITNITKNMTLTAIYDPVSYTVKFNAEGGDGTMNDQTFEYDVFQKLTKNAFTKTGYTFLGWSTTSGGKIEYVDEAMVGNLADVSKTVNLYAVWKAVQGETFVVSFDLAGGAGGFPALKAVGGTVTLPSDEPVKTGHAFKEWKCGDETYHKGETITGITTDMILTAVYEPNKYVVHFDGNGSTGGSMGDQTFNYGKSYNLPANAFTKDGFRFVGWSIDGTKVVKYADEENVMNLAESGTVTLYAVWEPKLEIKTDTVNKGDSFDMEIPGTVGAVTVTEPNGSERMLTYGTDYELSNGTTVIVLGECTGRLSAGSCVFRVYTANGGAIDGVAEGTVKIADPRPDPPSPPEPVPTPTRYEVSYDIAGGSEPGPGTMMYDEGDTAEAASYNGKKDGYYFDGWTCNGKTYKAGDEFVVSGNMKFTAIWIQNSNPVPEPSENNTGLIVGIVVGVIAAVALIGGTAYFVKKK